MLTVPITYPQNDISREMFLKDLKAAGADKVLLVCCEFFFQGDERIEKLNELKKDIEFYQDAGYEVGIWTNSLGWGGDVGSRGDYFNKLNPNPNYITSFDGKQSAAVCVLDDNFAKLMEQNIIDFAKLGAKLIILDDDFVLCVRPGFTCACDLHVKEFENITERKWTREEIKALFTGSPNKFRTMWMDLMGKTMIDYCKRLRKAADSIDPEVTLGLCDSYTHFDLDGFDVSELVHTLAGNNKPFLRLSGSSYWANTWQKFPGMKISDVVEFVRMQTSWLNDTDIDFCDENDSYPCDSNIIPSMNLEVYDRATLTQSRRTRLKYLLHYGQNKDGDTSYFETHLKYIDFDNKVAEFFKDKEPIGWRIYCSEHKIREADLPKEYMGDFELSTHFTMPFAGIFANKFGVPTKYDGNGPVVVFSEDAINFPNELKDELIVADKTASAILKSKNISAINLDYNFDELDYKGEINKDDLLNNLYPHFPYSKDNLYILASVNKTDDEMAMLITNDNKTDFTDTKIILNGKYELVDFANCEAKINDNILIIDKIASIDSALVLLKKN